MRFLKILPLLLLPFLVQAQTILSTELDSFERSLENKIKMDLSEVLGSKEKVLVKVQARIAPARIPSATDASSDFGYLPIPFSTGTEDEGKRIESVAVQVKVPAPMNPDIKKQVEDIVRFSTSGLRARVTVSDATFKDIEAERKLASEEANKPLEEKPLDWPFITKTGIAFLGLVLFLVVSLLFRSALSMASENVAGGIRSLKSIKLENIGDDKEDEATAKADPTSNRDPDQININRNLKTIKDILAAKPKVFLETLTQDENDLRGMRWLLTQLDTSELASLKKVLSESYFGKIKNISISSTTSFAMDKWIQAFVEKLLINQIQGAKLIDEALSSEEQSVLFTWPREALIETTLKHSNKTFFRLLSEILSVDELGIVAARLTNEQWPHFLSAADVTAQDIKQSFAELTQQMATQTGSPQNKEKFEFVSQKLLKPTVEAALAFPPGEDEKFLERLKSLNADLHGMVRKELWTPNDLNNVPPQYLKTSLTEQDTDTLFSLMMALPEPWPSTIEKSLPEGNKKSIVLDLVKRAKGKGANQELSATFNVTRTYLLNLRKKALDGEYELLNKEEKSA
ncbi:MAG: hypothetical protein AB7F59_13235 [Bdellovibrionales bacterium]